MSEVIKTYKGFNKDMTCKYFQYKEGKEYEESNALVCETGFHACEYPLNCLSYYNPAESVYHEVEQSGKLSRNLDDSKRCVYEEDLAGVKDETFRMAMERVLKEYCKKHEGKFFAVYEEICRVKE